MILTYTREDELERAMGSYDPDWTQEEIAHVVSSLRAVLRNPNATEHEKQVARDMLKLWED